MPTLLATRLYSSDEIIQEFFDVTTPVELQLEGQASAHIKRDGIQITTLTPQNRTYKLFTIGTYEINLFGKCLSGTVSSYDIAVSGGSGATGDDSEFETLCDDTLGDQTAIVLFLRRYSVDELGAVTVVDTELDGVAPYTTLGTVGACPTGAGDSLASPATAAPNFINSSIAGSTTAGLQKFSVSNVGEASGVLLGDPLPVGASVTFEGYYDEATNVYVRLDSASYDATGTVFLIAETA